MRALFLLAVLIPGFISGSELIVDWSLDLVDPAMSPSPILALLCIQNRSEYWVHGTPQPGQLHRYILPDEITGRCILSIGGGIPHFTSFGVHEIDVTAKGTVHTKFPQTSVYFEFELNPDPTPTVPKELHLFKIGDDRLPLANFVYFTGFRIHQNSNSRKKIVVIPYAGAGEYIAYVTRSPEDSCCPFDDCTDYLYAKSVRVNDENLITHTKSTKLKDSLKDANRIHVEFTPNDRFGGMVGMALVRKAAARHVSVDSDGTITDASSPPIQGKPDRPTNSTP